MRFQLSRELSTKRCRNHIGAAPRLGLVAAQPAPSRGLPEGRTAQVDQAPSTWPPIEHVTPTCRAPSCRPFRSRKEILRQMRAHELSEVKEGALALTDQRATE